MGSIIIEVGQSVDPWEPSSLRGDIVCRDNTEWPLAIIDGRRSACTEISGFMIKNEKQIVTK